MWDWDVVCLLVANSSTVSAVFRLFWASSLFQVRLPYRPQRTSEEQLITFPAILLSRIFALYHISRSIIRWAYSLLVVLAAVTTVSLSFIPTWNFSPLTVRVSKWVLVVQKSTVIQVRGVHGCHISLSEGMYVPSLLPCYNTDEQKVLLIPLWTVPPVSTVVRCG
jgi:hypothetical protein